MKWSVLFFIVAFSWGFLSSHYQFFPFQSLLVLKRVMQNELPETVETAIVKNSYWQNRVDIFSSIHIAAKNVMIGDSITERAEWQALLPDISIVNRGIASDTTYGVLNRLDSIFSLKPKNVFIMLGINDILMEIPPQKIRNNYFLILQKLQQNKIVPIIQSTLYVAKNHSKSQQINIRVKELNDELLIYANKNNILFIDLNTFLSPNNMLNDELTNDSIHLNGHAYQIWKSSIEPYLKK